MTDKEAMKLALFALDIVKIQYTQSRHINEAITALKDRLADPMREVQRLGQEIEQEPICPECKAKVLYECVACSSNNYPPQRTWVGLTDEEMHECAGEYPWTPTGLKCVRTIEAKLKQKNGYAEEKNT